MTDDERQRWDDRYRSGEYEPRLTAGPFLASWLERIPVGRALDVGCGAGRNAIALAEAGHRVDAVDVSAVAIEMAGEAAAQRGLDINWIVADLDSFAVPTATYDLITVIRYKNRDLWSRVIDGLAPNGWLLVEHHFATDLDVDGPGNPDFRFEPQEMLDAFSALRVVFYEENIEYVEEDGPRPFALARLVACKGNPGF